MHIYEAGCTIAVDIVIFNYVFSYSPLSRMIFYGSKDGEFWYQLHLEALNPKVVCMPLMECEVGRYGKLDLKFIMYGCLVLQVTCSLLIVYQIVNVINPEIFFESKIFWKPESLPYSISLNN